MIDHWLEKNIIAVITSVVQLRIVRTGRVKSFLGNFGLPIRYAFHQWKKVVRTYTMYVLLQRFKGHFFCKTAIKIQDEKSQFL